MRNARRLSELDCRWFLLALGLMAGVSRADTAGPGLLDYLRACGIGDDAFARFADDRQIAAEELDVIRRIAVRLRDCPELGRIANLPIVGKAGNLPHVGEKLPSAAEAKSQRGRMFQLQGSVVSVEPVEDPNSEPLWRCTLAMTESPRRVVVYVADLTEKLRTHGAGQHVALDGVFAKYVPGATAEPMAVVVAPRLEHRPDSPLGNLGMDFGLFEGIRDGAPMTAADHDAFYRLLRLTRKADSARFDHDAERLDESFAGLPALFRDPASQRGRLVKVSGMARRVVRVPIDDPAVVSRLGADHYFEIDVVAEGSQGNPLVFCTSDLPVDMPLGGPPSYGESVEVTGFFLKNWQYRTALSEGEKAANPGSFQALQAAPLVIGAAPLWKRAVAEKKNTTASAVAGLLVLVMIGVCLLLWHLRQTDQEFSRQVFARE